MILFFFLKGPSPPSPPPPPNQPPPPPPATRECACGVCDSENYDDGDDYVFDDEGRECCRYVDRTPECFPAAARVFLENGKMVKISELQIGDRVQTG